MQFSVNSIEKAKLQYIHLYDFLLDLYFIALGYENALNQIGYTTGVRYSVKQIVITVYNADGSETTTHSLVPARDSNGTICLYDTVSHKSYYPFHGTLDII